MRHPGGCGADRVSDGYRPVWSGDSDLFVPGRTRKRFTPGLGPPRGAGVGTLGCWEHLGVPRGPGQRRDLPPARVPAGLPMAGAKFQRGPPLPEGASPTGHQRCPSLCSMLGVPKPPAPFRVSAGAGGFPHHCERCTHVCQCVTPLCQCVTPVCQCVTYMCQCLTRVLGALSRCQHSAPGSDKAPTGCDCQAELEGLEILGWIIRFHIVTAAAIGGSGRLISPPLCSLIFIRMLGGRAGHGLSGERRDPPRQPLSVTPAGLGEHCDPPGSPSG